MQKLFLVFSVFALLFSVNLSAQDQPQTAPTAGDAAVSSPETAEAQGPKAKAAKRTPASPRCA